MMKGGKSISPAEVDFWLDANKYSNYFEENSDPSNDTLVFNIDMVRLSSIRKAISNFVRILTRKNIPVYFNDIDANVNFNGKTIYISANINTKQDFDVAVGQALHEGAHTLKTNFNTIKTAWANIPSKILKLSDSKNIRRASLEKFIHNTWNVIEDRFIDNYVFNEAPGYRGYYVALYNKFWNCAEIDELLLDPDLFRYPSFESYSFRITNFTNKNTDLLALPRLDEIAKVIDISNIDRLTSTKKRINTAFDVVEIVLDCLDKNPISRTISSPIKNKIADPRDYFDFGEDDGEESSKEVDISEKMIKEISDVLTGKDNEPEKLKENSDIINKISNEDISKELSKKIKDINETQRKFLSGELPKEQLTSDQKSLLDLIEKHGIVLVQVDVPHLLAGDDKNLKVDCIVVQNMTKDLILSGNSIFPLSSISKVGNLIPKPTKEGSDAVNKGIQIGTKLGRKLQIRAEVNPIKTIRKKWGKVNQRQLHEASFDADDLFYKINIEERHDANIHITVDASSSMMGVKWEKTMTSVVAICKAASMIDNIHVTVSFRSTQNSNNTILPYIVLAYDSKKDKFSKIKNLFPFLSPNGWTPEGLAFSAIMNLFEKITPDEEDRYFLNLSDGEPFYSIKVGSKGLNISYVDEVGVTHTKSQIDKIRKLGVYVLSYFISNSISIKKNILNIESSLQKNFKRMYGKNAKFINVESVLELAKTINDLFLQNDNEKRS